MLLLSVESVMGEVEEVLHHEVGVEQVLIDVDSAGGEIEDSHCQHCCHSHATNVGPEMAAAGFIPKIQDNFPLSSLGGKVIVGPPTPPPNA